MLIEYRGANGLNYCTKEDADLYGGGCVGKINNAPRDLEPVVEELEPVQPVPASAASGEEAIPQAEVGQGQNLTLNDLTTEQLREYAKEKKIKGYGILGRERLIQKLSV